MTHPATSPGDGRGGGADLRTLRRLALAAIGDPGQFFRPRLARTCPVCGRTGMMISVGKPPRWDARCPRCGSRERHRLMHLWVSEGGGDRLAGLRVLHFAPEKIFMRRRRGDPLYETADLFQPGVTHRIDISKTGLPDGRYDAVIAHHVLEHIDDDRAAMREIFRILRPGGFAVLSVPLNPSRAETYENPKIVSPADRHHHFGQHDHKRVYGLDFAARLEAAGFDVEIFRAPPEDEVRYSLLRDEWLTIARKPGPAAA